MPELRKDIITGGWIIVATERAKRPEDFSERNRNVSPEVAAHYKSNCPFCVGNESQTPPEIEAFREPGSKENSEGWRVRTTPNKFPALVTEQGVVASKLGIYEVRPGSGAHEVIVETTDHSKSPALMDKAEMIDVVRMYLNRYKALCKDSSLEYVQVFRNHGKTAGASMEHPHSQIIATPLVPPDVQKNLNEAKSYYEQNANCLLCDVVKEELSQGKRIVFENSKFLVLEPFASKGPFETWIVPREHMARFEQMDEIELSDFAEALKLALKSIHEGLSDPAYNFTISTAPTKIVGEMEKYFHWYLKIIPKLTTAAGFEIGTGIYINVATPEDTAMFLKSQLSNG